MQAIAVNSNSYSSHSTGIIYISVRAGGKFCKPASDIRRFKSTAHPSQMFAKVSLETFCKKFCILSCSSNLEEAPS